MADLRILHSSVLATLFLTIPAAAQGHDEKPGDAPRETRIDAPAAPVASQNIVTRGPFQSIQVNVNAQGNNIANDAANEPSIAIDPANPSNIVIGWRQFDSISSNFRESGLSYSQDAGATWTFPGSILNGQFNSDPVLATDSQGNFYYLAYPGGTTLRVYKSTDAGQNWSTSVVTTGGDKAWMAVDRTGGIGNGNVYLIWQVAHGPNTFSRSVNGGASFGSPTSVPLVPTFGTLTVDSAGNVLAAGLNQQFTSSFVLARSANAQNPGQTPSWSSSGVNLGGSMRISAGPNPGGLLGQAQVVVDPRNEDNVYMLCSVNPPGADPLDVHLIRSTNAGNSFGEPVRINDDSSTSSWQWFGTMSVASTGRLDVVWNDTRNSASSALSETFYSYSLDNGLSWSVNVPVSPQFNSTVGWPNQSKIGDYYDMVSDTAAAHLAYSATFNGEQDLYYLKLGDCNGNQTHDGVDLQNGTSFDSNANTTPDECESCQTDLGSGGGTLTLSLCGDDLTQSGSAATLDLVGATPNTPILLALASGQHTPPIALPFGGSLVPRLAVRPSTIFGGYTTNADGRLGVAWTGGTQFVATLYAQVVVLTGPGQAEISNALEIEIGV